MYKKINIIIALLCLILFTASCAFADAEPGAESLGGAPNAEDSKPPFAPVFESEEIPLTFPEAIEGSDCVVVGKYLSFTDDPDAIRHEFAVKEILRGEIHEEVIHLYAGKGLSTVWEIVYTYRVDRHEYIVGEEYILVMNRLDSIFYDHPRCVLVTDIHIPAKDIKSGTMYDKLISDSYEGDILFLIKGTKMPVGWKSKNYTTAEDMPAIVGETDLILEVKIQEIYSEWGGYLVDVLNVLKGDPSPQMNDVILSLLETDLDVGGTYVVLVNWPGVERTGRIFTPSSYKSVFHVSDTKAIEEIKELIARG
ncbi:MAG: hypothetical protein FWG31_02920 [Oscillospiraceae bacterium]|nr:hypothetical protein [Oscillospiraceae bacterium]